MRCTLSLIHSSSFSPSHYPLSLTCLEHDGYEVGEGVGEERWLFVHAVDDALICAASRVPTEGKARDRHHIQHNTYHRGARRERERGGGERLKKNNRRKGTKDFRALSLLPISLSLLPFLPRDHTSHSGPRYASPLHISGGRVCVVPQLRVCNMSLCHGVAKPQSHNTT